MKFCVWIFFTTTNVQKARSLWGEMASTFWRLKGYCVQAGLTAVERARGRGSLRRHRKVVRRRGKLVISCGGGAGLRFTLTQMRRHVLAGAWSRRQSHVQWWLSYHCHIVLILTLPYRLSFHMLNEDSCFQLSSVYWIKKLTHYKVFVLYVNSLTPNCIKPKVQSAESAFNNTSAFSFWWV